MSDFTREGYVCRNQSDETRAAWFWLFKFYGAGEAVRLGDKWGFE